MKRRRPALILFLLLISGAILYLAREASRERRFTPQLSAAAKLYHVDPLLIKAVAWRESRFHPEARGLHGELGLMQIREIAAQEWADAEGVRPFAHDLCLDPGTNALAATFYLGKLLKRYARADDPAPYALADFNAGRGNVLKWTSGAAATNSAVFIRQIGFPQTKSYVKSVMRRRAFYRFLASLGWN